MADKPEQKKNEELIAILRDAIQQMHGCEATWLEAVDVMEYFEGQLPWLGEVQVFELTGHPNATRCYAWARRLKDSEEMDVVAILNEGWVDAPEKAVRVAVVAEKDQRQVQLESVEFNIEQLKELGEDFPDYEKVMQTLQEQRDKLRGELGLT